MISLKLTVHQYVFGLAALGIFFSCSGCSFFSGPSIWPLFETERSEAENEIGSNLDFEEEQSVLDGPQAPVEVSVSQAFFDENELKIKIHLSAKTTLPANEVVVGVTGLREGNIVEEHLQIVEEVISAVEIQPDTKVVMFFSLKERDLTEYQVSCSWGEDAVRIINRAGIGKKLSSEPQARAALSRDTLPRDTVPEPIDAPRTATLKVPPPLVKRSLSLEDMRIERTAVECAFFPCDMWHVVHVRIVNNSDSEVSGIKIALGLYWVNAGELPKIPAADDTLSSNEQEISLDSLTLAPDASKRLRIKIDRPVPTVPGGSFIPHLRILPNNAS